MFKLKPTNKAGVLKLAAAIVLVVITIYNLHGKISFLSGQLASKDLDKSRSMVYRSRNTVINIDRSRDANRSIDGAEEEVTDLDADNDGYGDTGEDYLISKDEVLETMTERELMKTYLNYVERLQVRCGHVIRVGRMDDGGKEICIERKYKPHAPCLIYSFGINYDYHFDNSAVNKFGCDVHCFDPSMVMEETRKMSSNLWFYRWRLGSENTVNDKGWTIKTLDNIRKELGHVNEVIDILKIDIEGDEWPSIPQMISTGALSGVKQISMEIHFSKIKKKEEYWGATKPAKALAALRLLYAEGFRIFMRERNLGGIQKLDGIDDYFTNVYEISLIRVGR